MVELNEISIQKLIPSDLVVNFTDQSLNSKLPKINFKKVKFKNFNGKLNYASALKEHISYGKNNNVSDLDYEVIESPLRKVNRSLGQVEKPVKEAQKLDIKDQDSGDGIVGATVLELSSFKESVLEDTLIQEPKILMSWPPKPKNKLNKKNTIKKKKSKKRPYFIVEDSSKSPNLNEKINEIMFGSESLKGSPWDKLGDDLNDNSHFNGLEYQLVDIEDISPEILEISQEKLNQQEIEVDNIFNEMSSKENIEKFDMIDFLPEEAQAPEAAQTKVPLIVRAIMPNIPKNI